MKINGCDKMKDIINIIKDGNVVIPLYLLKNYKKFDLSMDEFIFMMYLYNIGDGSVFNPSRYSNDLDINNKEVLKLVSVLVDKNYLSIDSIKNDKKIMDEVINLDGFYNKMSIIIMDKKESDSNIYSVIENEFGRTLSSMEYEIVKAWTENNISDELIKLALKEAVYNGVFNLRYIDKILYEWSKKGIKNSKDVEKAKKKYKDNKNKDIDMDLVNWNWFDEED